MLLLVALPASAATVYRSVDENGNIQYSDRPDGQDTETVVIRTRRISGATTVAAATRPADPNPSQSVTEEETVKEGPSDEEIAARKAENCSIAKERLERYVTSRRLYKVRDDGEREYLSDTELDEARAKAQADVEEWCS